MANDIDVFGTVTYPNEFFQNHKKEILKLHNEKNYGIGFYNYYLINPDEPVLNDDTVSFRFSGMGRWDFLGSLKSPTCHSDSEEMTNALIEENPKITFQYIECDMDSFTLYDQLVTVTFTAEQTDDGIVAKPLTDTKILREAIASVKNMVEWDVTNGVPIEEVDDSEYEVLFDELDDSTMESLGISTVEEMKSLLIDFIHQSPKYQGYIEGGTFGYYEELVEEIIDYYHDTVSELMQNHDIQRMPSDVKTNEVSSYLSKSNTNAAYVFEQLIDSDYDTHIHCYKEKDGEVSDKVFHVHNAEEALKWSQN